MSDPATDEACRMQLKLRPYPDNIGDLVSHALTHLAPPKPPSFDAVGESLSGRLESALPHPVYTLSWDALVAGEGLAAATHTGWRVIVLNGERAWAAVECGADLSADSAVVNQGPFVAATLDAVAAAEASSCVSGEVRLLEVPAVYTVAVWIYRKTGSPLFDLARGRLLLQNLWACSETNFISQSTGIAIERLHACEVIPEPMPRIERSVDAQGNESIRFLPPVKSAAVKHAHGRPAHARPKRGAKKLEATPP